MRFPRYRREVAREILSQHAAPFHQRARAALALQNPTQRTLALDLLEDHAQHLWLTYRRRCLSGLDAPLSHGLFKAWNSLHIQDTPHLLDLPETPPALQSRIWRGVLSWDQSLRLIQMLCALADKSGLAFSPVCVASPELEDQIRVHTPEAASKLARTALLYRGFSFAGPFRLLRSLWEISKESYERVVLVDTMRVPGLYLGSSLGTSVLLDEAAREVVLALQKQAPTRTDLEFLFALSPWEAEIRRNKAWFICQCTEKSMSA